MPRPVVPAREGEERPHRARGDWDADRWRDLDAWLVGVDLFNASCFWEAHEVWEGLWREKPKESAPGRTLQGLIQVAAAVLKVRTGAIEAAARLSDRGLAALREVQGETKWIMGLDLDEVVKAFTAYFGPLMERALPPLDARVPILELSVEDPG